MLMYANTTVNKHKTRDSIYDVIDYISRSQMSASVF